MAPCRINSPARMAESADAAASKAVVRKDVRVQVPLRARHMGRSASVTAVETRPRGHTLVTRRFYMAEDRWDSVAVPILEFVHENGDKMSFLNMGAIAAGIG